jgi:hypothetical protein
MPRLPDRQQGGTHDLWSEHNPLAFPNGPINPYMYLWEAVRRCPLKDRSEFEPRLRGGTAPETQYLLAAATIPGWEGEAEVCDGRGGAASLGTKILMQWLVCHSWRNVALAFLSFLSFFKKTREREAA